MKTITSNKMASVENTKHQCDRCDCEVGASDKLSDGSYRCDECFTFFAELNWNDPDNPKERIEDYLMMKREDV